MSAVARREEILRIIREKKNASSTELSKQLNVTEETVRRDLALLSQKGLITRTHGGAIIKDELESSFDSRIQDNFLAKQRIGKFAATLVQEKEAIFLDPSSTTFIMARFLKENSDIIVLTNSKYCLDELTKKNGITAISTGGILRKKSMSFVGKIAENSLKESNIHKAFLSVQAISLKNGIMDSNEQEANVNKIAIESALEVIVLADSSKFGRVAFTNVCSIDKISTLVTDAGISNEDVNELKKLGINVYIV